MIKEIELFILPEFIGDYNYLCGLTAKKLKLNENEISLVRVDRRSIDARKHKPAYRLKVSVFINEEPKELFQPINLEHVKGNKRVHIIGSGPAGLFAALKLIEMGIKPIIYERGKDVQERRRDLKAIQQDGIVISDSNYCFGEGGAGTYSDGKLYTRATKRGNVKRILNLLVQHGAQNEILIDAHPHIGSNILPKVITEIRETIIRCGGEISFNSKLTGIKTAGGKVESIIVNDSEEIKTDSVILATGHSARDIYYLLDKNKISLEAKDFAMGVRIEHPQKLIDKIQYHSEVRHPNLPASSYSLTCQIDGRGIYSFCMCPGGIVIPSATSPDELVLNGMSISRRDSPFANSGIVVTVTHDDWKHHNQHGIFAGLEFQKEIERAAFDAGGGNQKAPAQRVTDFLKKRTSSTLPKTSYIPGVISIGMNEILPRKINYRLAKAINYFGSRMKGYVTEEAQILAGETRTSSPIRILRDRETLMHPEVKGLFPAGEGAGYAGGIISAAIDGERCAEQAVKYLMI